MKNLFAFISRYSFINKRVISVFLVIVFLAIGADAQSRRLNDGSTPLGIAPGSPAGSFALSDFDTINPYNGNLNFRLPLINIGGRGSSGYTATLPINYRWAVLHHYEQEDLYRHYATNYRPYYAIRPDYRAGNFEVRNVEENECNQYGGGGISSLTTIIFTAPDGTEYEFRSEALNGAPGGATCFGPGSSRGTIWKTRDGSFMTFISDTVIYDLSYTSAHNLFGHMMFPDGTKYRIEAGKVSWIRDRNGNVTTFTYNGTHSQAPLIKVTDSIGREITFAYDVPDSGQYGLHDQITYKGFGGQPRTIRISYKSLSEVLRSDQTIQTYQALFGELDSVGVSPPHNPANHIAAVWLPNGQAYRFYYNSYSELARVELPTGGAFEYDWGALLPTGYSYDDGIVYVSGSQGSFPEIYRQVLTKRIYPEGGTGNSFALKSTFSQTQGQGTTTSSKTIEQRDANNNLIGQTKHYFHGNPVPSYGTNINFKPAWDEGKEYQTEIFDILSGNPALKQQVNQTWQKGAGIGYNEGNARLIEKVTTLVDTNQISKQTFSYDQFNNQTDVYEYDYSTGATGAFKRRTHTDFVTDTNYTSATGAHLRFLPLQTWISAEANGATKASMTQFEYDNYAPDANHASLTARSNVVGFDSTNFGINYSMRGNITAVTSYGNAQNQTGAVSVFSQYDILGNVVKTIDAKGYATTINYSDRYGAPDGNAQINTSPTELGALLTFAFQTNSTNPLGWITGYSQFDYYTGQAVDVEDVNGVVNSVFYEDFLDRPKKIITANNQPNFRRQTIIDYADNIADRKVTIFSDLFAFDDKKLKSESLYDGLGRTIESRKFEEDGNYSAVKSIPFIMIQDSETSQLRSATQSTNPYRPGAGEQPVWTTSLSDSLGRNIKIITPDGAFIKTAYSGNTVTVTDQAGKQRRSITNALGQLMRIDEPDSSGNLGSESSPIQPTYYKYNTLGKMIEVTQGVQQRHFLYDSLSRLLRVRQPEQQINSALNLSNGETTNTQWTAGFSYDNNGNLLTATDAKNLTATNAYDALNRVQTRAYSDSITPTVTYTYDDTNVPYSKGRLTKVSSSVSEMRHISFDQTGRLLSSEQATGGQVYPSSYKYNLAGIMTEQTYPSGRVVKNLLENDADLSAIVSKVENGQFKNYASNFSYTASGVIKHLQLGNGLWESAKLNSRYQITELNMGYSPTDGSLWQLKYDYGELDTNGNVDATKNSGNIAKQTISFSGLANPFVQTYKYDSLDRIKEAEEKNNGNQVWKQTWGYDRYSNRTGFTQAVHGQQLPINTQTLPTVDANTNRFQTGQGYTYDLGGNLIQDAEGRQFIFDGDNKQVEVKNGSNVLVGKYFYDGNGKRVKKIEYDSNGVEKWQTIFVYDGTGKLVAEYSSEPLAQNPTVNYTATDPLGSPRVITNKQGAIVSRRDFMPFGEQLMPDATYRKTDLKYNYGDTIRQKFTGYERDDETGLDFAEARYYNNKHGRFTAVDPLLASGKSTNPQTFNRYAYTMNRPLVLSDPTGLQSGQPPADKRKPNVGVSEIKVGPGRSTQPGNKTIEPGRTVIQISIDTSQGVGGTDGTPGSAIVNLSGATLNVQLRRTNSDVQLGFVAGNQPNPPANGEPENPTSIVLSGTITKPGDPVVLTATVVVPEGVPEGGIDVILRAEILSVTQPNPEGGGTEVLTDTATPGNARVTINPPFKETPVTVAPRKETPPPPQPQPKKPDEK